MELGFGLPVSGGWATPAGIRAIAALAEELGYAELWSFQRLLVPVDAESRPSLPPVYRSVLDPLVALSFAAAVTSRIRLGVAIVNLPYYSPALLAKQVATLDVVSDGRLDLGVGLGWAAEEFVASGVPYERRGARAEEFVRCLEAIWRDDVVEFAGEFYAVPRSRIEPKPVQRPRPPLLFGGTAAPALRRAGRLGDGWISSSRADLGRIGDSIREVRQGAESAGRDPENLRFVVRGVLRLTESDVDEASRRPLSGSAVQVRADLQRLAGAGITQVFLDLNFAPEVGSPVVPAAAGIAFAESVLREFAPA